MSERFEASRTQGAHAHLARLVGEWKGTTKVWFEPEKVADESSISGTMRLVLGGRFIMHEYRSGFGGNELEGIALYGYHLELNQFQAAWVDSFHNGTAIMYSAAKRGDDSINVLGGYTYVSEQGETRWGWRTEIDVVSDDELRITAYNITPDGVESRATETNYQRIK